MRIIAIIAAVFSLSAATAFAQTDKQDDIEVSHPWVAPLPRQSSPTAPCT